MPVPVRFIIGINKLKRNPPVSNLLPHWHWLVGNTELCTDNKISKPDLASQYHTCHGSGITAYTQMNQSQSSMWSVSTFQGYVFSNSQCLCQDPREPKNIQFTTVKHTHQFAASPTHSSIQARLIKATVINANLPVEASVLSVNICTSNSLCNVENVLEKHLYMAAPFKIFSLYFSN